MAKTGGGAESRTAGDPQPQPSAAAARPSPPPAPDQRQHRRFELTAFVDYTGTDVLLYHRIENISIGGLRLRSTAVDQVGTEVELVINFPELDASVELHGEVAWVDPREPTMGIRFIGTDESTRRVLGDYIRRMRRAGKTPPR